MRKIDGKLIASSEFYDVESMIESLGEIAELDDLSVYDRAGSLLTQLEVRELQNGEKIVVLR